MKKINIQNEANIKAEGKLNSRHCKPVICLETGEVFSSVTDAAEAIGCAPNNLSTHLTGKLRTVKGKHFCYLSRVNESLDVIVTRLRETAAVEADAKKWQAYKAEQDAIRKAEEERQERARKEREEYEARLNKARTKVENRQTIRDRIAAQLAEADRKLMEAEIELEALEDANNQETAA